MRLGTIALIFSLFLWLALDCAESQLVLGPSGPRLPPINLVTVYRILRRTWKYLTSPSKDPKSDLKVTKEAKTSTLKEKSPRELNVTETEAKDSKVVSCQESENHCNNPKINDLLNEIDKTTKRNESDTLEESVDELVSPPIIAETRTGDTELTKSEKQINFIPQPFNSIGWIASYIALNGVLLGLYIFLAAPYFLTGRTVKHIEVVDEYGNEINYMPDVESTTALYGESDEQEEETEKHEHEMNNVYMGYTSYGEKDEFAKHAKQKDPKAKQLKVKLKISRRKKQIEAKPYLGYTSYGDTDMLMNYIFMEDDEDDSMSSNRFKRHEEETVCLQNALCLKPVTGAQALSASSMVFNIVEWLSGVDFRGKIFKKNMPRLEEAIDHGRRRDCLQYVCKRK